MASKPVYVARPGLRRDGSGHGRPHKLGQRPGRFKLAATVADEGEWDDCIEEMHTTIIVHEEDEPEEGTFIGLFDADGDPLYRESERIPIGFHHRDDFDS